MNEFKWKIKNLTLVHNRLKKPLFNLISRDHFAQHNQVKYVTVRMVITALMAIAPKTIYLSLRADIPIFLGLNALTTIRTKSSDEIK